MTRLNQADMLLLQFDYEKPKVLQALRYHFISRREIRLMVILVNLFALASITLYAFKKITPLAFFIGSFLWIILMLSFWFFLPGMVYRRASTFRHAFRMRFDEQGFTLQHGEGGREWNWKQLSSYLESPHFFHLYFDSRSFLLVPKDACKDGDEMSALRQLISSKVPKG